MSIFNFITDINNYSERKVDRYEYSNAIIDTCYVSDGDKPFETAVKDVRYNNDWIVVEAYDTIEEAKLGHDKWILTMTSNPPPKTLIDCQNAGIAQLLPIERLTYNLKQ